MLPTSSFEEFNLKVFCAVAYMYRGIPHSGIIIPSIATFSRHPVPAFGPWGYSLHCKTETF